MIWSIIYIVAYLFAGAPTITSIEGWVVFGAISVALTVATAIASISPTVVIQQAAEVDVDDEL